MVGKACHQFSLLQGLGGRAGFGLGDEGGEIFLLANVPGDVPAPRPAGGPGGVQAVLVAVLGGTMQLVVIRMGPWKASNSSFCCHQALP